MAVELSSITRADPPCPPSDRLLHIMIAGMEKQIESKEHNIYDENAAGIGWFDLLNNFLVPVLKILFSPNRS